MGQLHRDNSKRKQQSPGACGFSGHEADRVQHRRAKGVGVHSGNDLGGRGRASQAQRQTMSCKAKEATKNTPAAHGLRMTAGTLAKIKDEPLAATWMPIVDLH